MTRTRKLWLAMGALLALFLGALAPSPAQATPTPTPTQSVCGAQVLSVIDVTKTGPSATAVFDVDGGLVLETVVNDDSVHWKKMFAADLPLALNLQMSYRTKKLDNGMTNAAALPAYRLFMTGMDGPNADTTLVFEPYYQISGNPSLGVFATWDVDAGKFWATKTVAGITAEPGGSYAGNKTLAEIKAANPGARIKAIGIGQGTYNAGTKAWVNNVKFGCAEYRWVQPNPSPSASSSSASASASPSASTTPVGNGTDTSGLPVTGAKTKVLGVLGAGLVVVGGLIAIGLRRNRVKFQA